MKSCWPVTCDSVWFRNSGDDGLLRMLTYIVVSKWCQFKEIRHALVKARPGWLATWFDTETISGFSQYQINKGGGACWIALKWGKILYSESSSWVKQTEKIFRPEYAFRQQVLELADVALFLKYGGATLATPNIFSLWLVMWQIFIVKGIRLDCCQCYGNTTNELIKLASSSEFLSLRLREGEHVADHNWTNQCFSFNNGLSSRKTFLPSVYRKPGGYFWLPIIMPDALIQGNQTHAFQQEWQQKSHCPCRFPRRQSHHQRNHHLGRGGSDTSAVAIAAALSADLWN